MSENSKIQWTDHTFNPWWGCTKVPGDPACHNCYAEAWAKRTGFKIWGQSKPRRELSDANWRKPVKWNRDAERAGVRQRVFCASMADVFENRADLDHLRFRLWALIEATPWLDWLLLTKRPENIRGMLAIPAGKRGNVWLGTTAVTQRHYDERVGLLMENRAAVRFVSIEPIAEPIDLRLTFELSPDPDWIIVGGESGPRAREVPEAWIRGIVSQCAVRGGPACFVKQLGKRSDLRDPKGGDPAEWGAYLRVRQFPAVAS